VTVAAKNAIQLNLALQGGGAHGAFTWGVLDALLEDPSVAFGTISGTSAGAVNAVALASGLATGGREGARTTLKRIWTGVVDASVPDAVKFNPLLAVPWATLANSNALAQMATLFSPYDLNPLGIDPLRKLLTAELDITSLRNEPGPELLIAATDVATGRARLFRRAEISIDAVLASACLPTLHHAVEIDGRAYWDGGFSANPDILTLAAESPIADTLIVQLSAVTRDTRPTTAREIATHISYLTFNRPYVDTLERIATLQARPQAAGLLSRWLTPKSADDRIARHRFHLIDAGRFTSSLPTNSQGKPDEAMIGRLFHAGRGEAAKWLDRHRDDIGHRDTADLATRLMLARSHEHAP
jgi:NTE family protein